MLVRCYIFFEKKKVIIYELFIKKYLLKRRERETKKIEKRGCGFRIWSICLSGLLQWERWSGIAAVILLLIDFAP